MRKKENLWFGRLLALGVLVMSVGLAVSFYGYPKFQPSRLNNYLFGLRYQDARFATVGEEGEPVLLEKKPTYKQNQPVIFALIEVGPFAQDEDGLNFVDMDLVVTGPDGEVVLDKSGLLGEGGHLELENNMAPSPNGVFVGAQDLQEGEYTMHLTVYDKISGAQISDRGTFILENWTEDEEEAAETYVAESPEDEGPNPESENEPTAMPSGDAEGKDPDSHPEAKTTEQGVAEKFANTIDTTVTVVQ